jgi:transcriptional regulator with XRE-family HTH domain
MPTAREDAKNRRRWLSQALKALRRRRGLRPADVARAMRMPLRSYEYFEAVEGRINLDRIHQFASVLNADPYAILVAMEIGSPEFAVRCADNKLVTILTMVLQDFDAATGDAMVQLDPQTLTAALTRLTASLSETAHQRAAAPSAWLFGPPKADDEPEDT